MPTPSADNGPGNGPNGRERLSGTIAGHTFTLNVRDLISVLLLVGIFVLGYLVWEGQRAAMQLLYEGQKQIDGHLEAQDQHLREQTHIFVRLLYALDFNQGKTPEQRVPLHLYEPGSSEKALRGQEDP